MIDKGQLNMILTQLETVYLQVRQRVIYSILQELLIYWKNFLSLHNKISNAVFAYIELVTRCLKAIITK